MSVNVLAPQSLQSLASPSIAAPLPSLAVSPSPNRSDCLLQPLADHHSASLQGGRRGCGRSSLSRRSGGGLAGSGGGGFGGGGFGLMAMVQSLLVNVSQLNFSFNIAINGSTIQTTQLNGLTLDASV
jgi:hypothetical protein